MFRTSSQLIGLYAEARVALGCPVRICSHPDGALASHRSFGEEQLSPQDDNPYRRAPAGSFLLTWDAPLKDAQDFVFLHDDEVYRHRA